MFTGRSRFRIGRKDWISGRVNPRMDTDARKNGARAWRGTLSSISIPKHACQQWLVDVTNTTLFISFFPLSMSIMLDKYWFFLLAIDNDISLPIIDLSLEKKSNPIQWGIINYGYFLINWLLKLCTFYPYLCSQRKFTDLCNTVISLLIQYVTFWVIGLAHPLLLITCRTKLMKKWE
jgi:hypothetical protein